MKSYEYKGWIVEKIGYTPFNYEAYKIDDCDQSSLFGRTIEEIELEIDEKEEI